MVFRIINQLIRALRVRYYGSTRNESANKDDVETVNGLPATCLRGLRLSKWVVEGRYVATEAFLPDKRTAANRADGGLETSVNWEDDNTVEARTLADVSMAQHGAARITTAEITRASRTTAAIITPLSCERKPLRNNPYHGNIVYCATIPKILRTQLAATLAMKSRLILPLSESSRNQ